MQTKNSISIFRIKITRLVFVFILISLIFRYCNNALLHQLLNPTIFVSETDYTYWIYHLLNLKYFIFKNNVGAIIIDCSLFILCVINIVKPKQRIFIVIFTVMYALYFLTYNTFATHHQGAIDGILLITFAFWCKKDDDFYLFWLALRYFTISIYFAAFVWKCFIRGSVFHITQAEAVVKDNVALYLFQNPTTSFAHFIYFFLQHPTLLFMGYTCCISLQGLISVGYFTKKYDKILIFLPLIFHLCTYAFVDVCFLELTILSLSFISVKRLVK